MNWNDYRKAIDALPFSDDFQERMLLHVQNSSERTYIAMKKRTFGRIAAVAACLALLTITAYAAILFMSPAQTAEFAGQPLLAQAFESEDAQILNESAEAGDYRVTLTGIVSGASLDNWNRNVNQERTYAVVVLERLDSTPMDTDFPFEDFTLTPLVSGFTPWTVNNWTLDAGVYGFARDGFYYYLLDVQSLEMFADHTVYLAFYQGGVPSRDIFNMNEDGTIRFGEDFEEPHSLFTLPLDKAKADPTAVEAFMENSGFERDWFTNPMPDDDELDFITRTTEDMDGKTMEILPASEPNWMSVEDYEAYAKAEKLALAEQVKSGALSQATYNQSLQELNENLAGVQDGSLWAAQLSNGGISVVTNPEISGEWDLSYLELDNGIASIIK